MCCWLTRAKSPNSQLTRCFPQITLTAPANQMWGGEDGRGRGGWYRKPLYDKPENAKYLLLFK